MAVQGATRADQRGPDASQPPAPDGAVATVAPPERGLEMQPEEKVTRARTHARTCRQPRCALADACTDARIGLHSTRTKHTRIHACTHTHTRARSHAHVHAYT